MENNSPDILVSIALATFNGQEFLHQQLESLVAQTYPFIEIVISDDNSTDETKNIISSFQQEYPNIYLFENRGNRGIKANFTNALTHCKGNYIALCDQDDIWMPQKIQMLVDAIGDHALIYHNSLFVDDREQSLQTTVANKFRFYSGNDPAVFLLFNCISGHACMFNKKLVNIALPFPEARFHDWWLAFVAAANGGVQYFPEILVHYRQHKKAATDLLKRKEKSFYEKEIIKYNKELEWFTRCASLAGNTSPLIERLEFLYRERKNKWVSPAIFYFVIKNRQTLFYVQKKNGFSIFFFALKFLWGLRIKKLIG